nr:RNA-directed DNA polymerase, eukaryota, reverse transcriptase zinc-binding domain protein [Tanacetum cinerariifolium]
MSFNSCGLGANKCKAIAKLCNKYKVSFLGIQETHISNLDPFKVKSTWGNYQFDFVEHPANGRSGDEGHKEILWNDLTDFMTTNHGHHLIFGDFNVDIPLGGHLFTRLNKYGDKLSKLDHFLASDSLAPLLQKFSGLVLDCHISDHRLVLLAPVYADFGPTPFKFYNSWLLDKNLHSIIADFWGNFVQSNCSNPIILFKNKMKALKIVIKEWSLNRKDSQTRKKEELLFKIKDFDANITTRYTDLSVDAQ